jgi:hypothetical protein
MTKERLMIKEIFKDVLRESMFEVGQEVDYHGRSGEVTYLEDGMVIVSFDDTGEEEAIDEDELATQNDLTDEDEFYDKDGNWDPIEESYVKNENWDEIDNDFYDILENQFDGDFARNKDSIRSILKNNGYDMNSIKDCFDRFENDDEDKFDPIEADETEEDWDAIDDDYELRNSRLNEDLEEPTGIYDAGACIRDIREAISGIKTSGIRAEGALEAIKQRIRKYEKETGRIE